MAEQSTRPRGAFVALRIGLPVLLVVAAGYAYLQSDGADPEAAGAARAAPVRTGPPVGTPVLPDLSPQPPIDVHTKKSKSDTWTIEFSSTLVNVGREEFLLHGTREGDDWTVEQDIPYSTSGVKPTPVKARMVWGGDGHNHWHIGRVATYRLLRLDEDGRVAEGDRGRVDTKIGFCFFDFHRELDRGPEERVHNRHSCGKIGDREVRMGLSPGWGDTYEWILPGQSIDIEGLPDGAYRLRAEADETGMFHEITRENNVTWVDLDLFMGEDGTRRAVVTDVGPEPR